MPYQTKVLCGIGVYRGVWVVLKLIWLLHHSVYIFVETKEDNMKVKIIKVESLVPIPKKRKQSPYKKKYPFADLKKVGDSFFVEEAKARHTIYSCLTYYNSRVDTKTKISIITRQEGKGLRVWRIE